MQCSSFYTVRAHKLRHSHLNFSTHSEAEQQARRASTQSSSEMSCWPHSSSSDLTSFKFAPEIPKFSFVLSFSFSKKRRVPMSLPRCRSKCSPPVLVAALYSSEHPRRAHPLRWRGGRVRLKEGEEEEGLQQSPRWGARMLWIISTRRLKWPRNHYQLLSIHFTSVVSNIGGWSSLGGQETNVKGQD